MSALPPDLAAEPAPQALTRSRCIEHETSGWSAGAAVDLDPTWLNPSALALAYDVPGSGAAAIAGPKAAGTAPRSVLVDPVWP